MTLTIIYIIICSVIGFTLDWRDDWRFWICLIILANTTQEMGLNQ